MHISRLIFEVVLYISIVVIQYTVTSQIRFLAEFFQNTFSCYESEILVVIEFPPCQECI